MLGVFSYELSAKWAVKGAPLSDSTGLEPVISPKSVESPGNEFAKDDYDLNRNLGCSRATNGSQRCEKKTANLSEGA